MAIDFFMMLELARANWDHPGRIWNLSLSAILPKSPKALFGPIAADIETTLLCNIDCVMCHRKELMTERTVKTISLDNFKKIIDGMPTLLKVNLQGMGEPLLTPGIFDMIRHLKQRKIIATFVCNGKSMDRDMARETIASGLNRVYFSIDSANPEQFSRYRRGANLDKIVENMALFIDERQKLGRSNPHAGIWMLLFNDNQDQIKGVLDIAKKTGIDSFHLQTIITDRGKDTWKGLIDRMRAGKTSGVIGEACAYAKKIGVSMSVHSYSGGVFKKSPEGLCHWPWKSLFISSETDVSPCCIIADPKVSGMGNVLQNGFEAVWNGPDYQDFRRALLCNELPRPCRGCYGCEDRG